MPRLLFFYLFLALAFCLSGCSCNRSNEDATPPPPAAISEAELAQRALNEKYAAILRPIRPFPDKFPRRTYMPNMRESEASGLCSPSSFSAGRDLVFVDDPRVWWESEHDGNTDDECDHSMHRDMELPFRRLVELCAASNATLRVQETYRASGIHSRQSTHKEGRGLDITCPMLDPNNPNPERPTPKSLEILAKLTWAAGFDWVYYECPKNSGPHIHASVRIRSAPSASELFFKETFLESYLNSHP